jgi:hypothetical protein
MKDGLPLFGIYPTNGTCVPGLAKVALLAVTWDKRIPSHVAWTFFSTIPIQRESVIE